MDTFEKIIGYDATKNTLHQLLSILQNKSAYEARGATLPHGLLMTSKPGLGKSTLAEIFMKESQRYSLIFHKDSDNESFLESLREAFSIVKRNAPSVILLEDIHLYGDSLYAPALESVMNAASIKSQFRGGKTINKADLTEAIQEIVYQLKRSDGEENPDIEQIALHEAGHVAVAEVLKPDSVSLVTILGDSYKPGMTQYYRDMEVSILDLATKSLAGKAGVELVYGHLDVGASNDIQIVLGYVRQWVEMFAGVGFIGVVFDRKSSSENQFSMNETFAAAKMEELYRKARSILHEHYDFLIEVQKALLEQETLLGSDIAAIKNHLQSANITINNADERMGNVL